MKKSVDVRLAEIIAKTLDGMILWSVWCNHYKNKKAYDKNKDKDLKEFSKYIAESVIKNWE